MMTLTQFKDYSDTTIRNKETDEWELAKPYGGMSFKQRVKDAWNVLCNRGVVVRWK